MRRGSLFWGTLFILAGTLFWLDNAGKLPAGVRAWDLLWPLALILSGVGLLIGQLLDASPVVVEQIGTNLSVPLAEAQRVALRVRHEVGALRMDAQATQGMALEGTCDSATTLNTRAGSELEIDLEQPKWTQTAFGGAGSTLWALHLTPEVPVTLDLHWGVGEKWLDLSAAQLRRLALKGGIGEVHVTLPRPHDEGQVYIESGVGAVHLVVPDGVAVSVQIDRGLGQVHVEHPHALSRGSVYETPDFSEATDRYVIKLKTGVGEIHLKAE